MNDLLSSAKAQPHQERDYEAEQQDNCSLYWMWRKGWEYEQFKKFGSHAGEPGNRHGVE